MDGLHVGHAAGAAAAGLVGGALLLGATVMTASIVDRSDVPVEAVSATTVAVSIAAALLVVAGVVVMALTKHRDVLLLAAAATILVLLSVVGLFSIGVLVAPFAVGAIYLLLRRSAGRTGLVLPLVAGPVIAVGLSILLIVWIQPPLVECRDGGAATSSRPWWSTGTSSGQGSSSVAGTEDASTGTLETPWGSYVFRCEGSDLTEFRRRGGR